MSPRRGRDMRAILGNRGSSTKLARPTGHDVAPLIPLLLLGPAKFGEPSNVVIAAPASQPCRSCVSMAKRESRSSSEVRRRHPGSGLTVGKRSALTRISLLHQSLDSPPLAPRALCTFLAVERFGGVWSTVLRPGWLAWPLEGRKRLFRSHSCASLDVAYCSASAARCVGRRCVCAHSAHAVARNRTPDTACLRYSAGLYLP